MEKSKIEKKVAEKKKEDEDFTEFLEWDEDTEDDFIHLIDNNFLPDQE